MTLGEIVIGCGSARAASELVRPGSVLVDPAGGRRVVQCVDRGGWLRTDGGAVNPIAPHNAGLVVEPPAAPCGAGGLGLGGSGQLAQPAAHLARHAARGDLAAAGYSDDDVLEAVRCGAISESQAMNQDT